MMDEIKDWLLSPSFCMIIAHHLSHLNPIKMNKQHKQHGDSHDTYVRTVDVIAAFVRGNLNPLRGDQSMITTKIEAACSL
jgi:hypothetical protein